MHRQDEHRLYAVSIFSKQARTRRETGMAQSKALADLRTCPHPDREFPWRTTDDNPGFAEDIVKGC